MIYDQSSSKRGKTIYIILSPSLPIFPTIRTKAQTRACPWSSTGIPKYIQRTCLGSLFMNYCSVFHNLIQVNYTVVLLYWIMKFSCYVYIGLFWLFINLLSTNFTKWSNTLKQFVGCYRQIVWVCLTILWDWRFKG